MATSFNSGFKLGTDMYNQAQRNSLAQEELALAKERDARAAEVHRQAVEEFGWRRDEQARMREKTARVDALTKQFTDPNAGNFALAPTGTGMGLRVSNQPAAEVPVEGLVAPQLASGTGTGMGLRMSKPPAADMSAEGLSVPQLSSEAPATGLRAPAMAERQMTFNKAPTGAAAEGVLGLIALENNDINGYRASQAAARGFRKDEIAADVMKMPLAEVEKLAPQVTKSGYPMLYTGKGKGGYSFLKTEADGVTPIPGSQFTLNESQLRQFAMAHKLGAEGFGTDALTLLSSAHKDMGDHIGKWNAAISGVTAANNQATNFANKDENQRAELAVKDRVARAQVGYYGQRSDSGSLREFVDGKGESVLVDISKLPRKDDGTVAMPAGLRPKAAKPEFTPEKYSATIKGFVDSGMSLPEARIEADIQFGRGPSNAQVDSKLQDKNGKVGESKKPIVLRPGEALGFLPPGATIRGPIEAFERRGTRGLFGGVSYNYYDPVGRKTYSVDEYNALMSE